MFLILKLNLLSYYINFTKSVVTRLYLKEKKDFNTVIANYDFHSKKKTQKLVS